MGPAGEGDIGRGEATGALAREVGKRGVERLGEGLTRLIGEASALYRWLLTMLVALNAGGIWLCLAGLVPDAPVGRPMLLALFFGGVMAALLAAIAGLALMIPVTRSIRLAMAHWAEVAATGAPSEESLSSAQLVRRMGVLWLAVTSFLALVSFALFLTGAGHVADGLSPAGVAVTIPDPAPAEAEADLPQPDNAAPAAEPQPAAATPAARATGSPLPQRQRSEPVRRSGAEPVTPPKPKPQPRPSPSPSRSSAPKPVQPAPAPAPSASPPSESRPSPLPSPAAPEASPSPF